MNWNKDNNYGNQPAGENMGTTGIGAGVGSSGAGAIIQMVVNRMAAGETPAKDEGYKNQSQITGGQDINSKFQSPFGASNAAGANMFPGAEKMLPSNWKPLQVAPAQANMQPVNVDSSQQGYNSGSPWANIYAKYQRY